MTADSARMLGKYQLIAEIARGGMGIVYLALVRGPGRFNKLVVVKELKPELVEEPTFLTMFLDEARLAARLNHANIVQTNEVDSDGHRHFMAMEYLEGRALDRVRRRARSGGAGVPLPMQLRILCELLAGLEYAHQLADFDGTPLHIVHRDISPQNVFVTFDGQVKILDFGIAKASGSMHETHAGVLKGKVSYMAPEQARGQKVDVRADVFSTGVMLWEALTGRRMREGQNGQEALWALASGDLPRASTVVPWIDPELDEICARAMAWDREQRYPSAAALREDLERYVARSGAHVSPRDLGQYAADLFSEDRATTNSLIEQHLVRARAGTAPGDLPIIHVASPQSSSGTTPSGSLPSRTSHERPAQPTQPTQPPMAPEPPPMPLPGAEAVSLPPMPGGAALAGRARAMRYAIPAIAALAIAALIILARSTDTPASVRPAASAAVPGTTRAAAPGAAPVAEPAAALAPPLSATAAARPTPAAPRSAASPVAITVAVSPPGALVTIDGAEVSGNPVQARYEADGLMHQIRATAPGYVAKTKAVPFEGDVALEIKLEKVPPPAPPAPTRAAAASSRAPTRAARAPEPPEPTPAPPPAVADKPEPPKPPVEATPAGGTKPRRTIDTTYPGEVSPAGGTKPRRTIDASNPYGAQ